MPASPRPHGLDSDTTSAATGSVKTLARGLDILRLFGTAGTELSQSDISNASGLPMPTVYRLVHTLVDHGFLEPIPPGRRYRPGPELVRLSGAALGRSTSAEGIHERLQQLSAATSETANLATLVGSDVIYLDSVTGPHRLTPTTMIGSRISAHCTALGRALLSQLDDTEIVARLGRGPYERLTQHTAVDWTQLHKRIDDVRRRGVAFSAGEFEIGLTGIAAAIPAQPGREPTAVNIALPSVRASAAARRKLEPIVAESAAAFRF